ncbi:DoxX family protein [Undibacterium baiyunense]|uniref:DoxX family protein n=1 Tax=Undibacterium baiyunense TaxID=2828731 RepID=A0A941I5W0_9BURK|nr:DoxX family protein [Undibacterium baiyunense]MBR7748339.1 DoxX family protein [Undibacterium baiyunense]
MNHFLNLHRLLMRCDALLHRYTSDVISFVLRGFIAWQFLKSALNKLRDWPSTISLFQDEYHVPFLSPELAAYLGTGAELLFSILLILGLFSSLSALALLFVNLMAVVSYPILWELECPAGLNDHFYWAVLLMLVIVFGAGKWSLDHWLRQVNQGRDF